MKIFTALLFVLTYSAASLACSDFYSGYKEMYSNYVFLETYVYVEKADYSEDQNKLVAFNNYLVSVVGADNFSYGFLAVAERFFHEQEYRKGPHVKAVVAMLADDGHDLSSLVGAMRLKNVMASIESCGVDDIESIFVGR